MKNWSNNFWNIKNTNNTNNTPLINSWINNMVINFLQGNNLLHSINTQLDFYVKEKIEKIKKQRHLDWYINYQSYEINKILIDFFNILKSFDESIKKINDIELTFIDRNKFDADLCVKLPTLLQKYKKNYWKEIIPKIVDLLNNSDFKNNSIISKIEVVGIYINITLSDSFLLSTLEDVFSKWDKYWENDTHKWESILVDYSSPNIAKHLHAWHIRSTIIGHVLSNLYNSNWYYTHRVNHINDWGGFWFLIEGYNRWEDKLNHFENKNDLLFYIYTLYRKWEKISKSEEEYNKLSKDDISELKKYYWGFLNYNDFCLLFKDFIESWKKRFDNLEKWNKDEVELWKKMVTWSIKDFNNFYNLLWTHQDYIIWESFYSEYWRNLVLELEKKWKVVLYSQKLANEDIKKLETLLREEKITDRMLETIKEEILRDIWAYIIQLDNFERFIVLKADNSSIYATRDLGAIKYRCETFSPSRIVYEVWQEQAEHFDKLFKSAEKIWINWVNFTHVYHWFYVDSKTKKKLSSRDGASNVQKLINESIIFFRNKYKNSDYTNEEIEDIAYKLAIWSIIFNDIKSDKKNPVLISNDIKEACESFEEAGWAYVMYSIVRAKSILAKIDNLNEITLKNVHAYKLDNIEKIIINEINRYPLVVKYAQENDNPHTLIDYLLNLSRNYNSYYNSHRVIDLEKVIETRVIITKAFIQIAKNALNICNIQIPNRI